jgi:hypothetical protein
MTSRDASSRLFMDNIRSYNSTLAYTSHGAKVVRAPNNGPPCYRIHGGSYHLMGSMLPPPDGFPGFAQIYFHDSADAQLEFRVAFARRGNLNIERNLLRRLQDIMLECNPFAMEFRMIGNRGLDNITRLRIKDRIQDDGRRYNTPTAAEISVLLPGFFSYYLILKMGLGKTGIS